MHTLLNPMLAYNTTVVLKDGRRAHIVDKAKELRTRRIDIDGDGMVPTERVHVKKIDRAFCHGIWYKCNWD